MLFATLVAFSFLLTHGVRRAGSPDTTDEVKGCIFEAHTSNSENFDVKSLMIEDPNFTFFESREFFLSAKPTCHEALDIKLRKAPNSTTAKRLQQEQRFHVKQITQGLNAAKTQQLGYTKDAMNQLSSSPSEELPAAELHMFPADPLDVNSKWVVLLVPKARDLFGETVYLCQKLFEQTAAPVLPVSANPCVAQLTFEHLPTRLEHFFGHWGPELDSSRSVPHKWVFAVEIFFGASVLLAVGLMAFILIKLVQNFCREDENQADAVATLLQVQLPKVYKLARHVDIQDDVCGNVTGALDACEEVTVLQVECSEGNVHGQMSTRVLNYLKSMVFAKAFQSVWGRLESPPGWILLHDSAGFTTMTDEKAPYRANWRLMIPIGSLLQRELILASSHASAQWLLLEQLAEHLRLEVIILIALTFFFMHILVLQQTRSVVMWGVYYDEVLEKERCRLRLESRHTFEIFGLMLAVLASTVLLGIATSKISKLALVLTPTAALSVAVFIHALQLNACLTALGKWREPELSCEFTEYAGEKLPTKVPVPHRTWMLSKKREQHALMGSFLSLLMATIGLWVLILMASDGLQMQGALVDYSFSEGHLVYQAGATAVQNTLLLHESADSISFVFEAATHTKGVTLKVEHPQLDGDDLQEVRLFPREDAEEEAHASMPATAGKYQLNLPPGPLYSRVTVEAESALKIRSTRYVFHLLRVGEAITLSLAGEVDKENRRVPFQEERRWLYQQQNAAWYVPALQGTCSLAVKLQPICFAPLWKGDATAASQQISQIHEECLCGEETAGFGTKCLKEDKVVFAQSTMCLFIKEAKDDVKVPGKGSLAGNGLVQWLQDVTISGKSAVLRLADESAEAETNHEGLEEIQLKPKQPLKSSNKISEISNVFEAVLSSDALMRGDQLVVGTSQDETNIEKQALPLKILMHPPPSSLNATHGFLLPPFHVSNKRSDYAACGMQSVHMVHASAMDTRFQVLEEVVELNQDCLGSRITQKRFWAVRNESCEYCDQYPLWNENYDVSVIMSTQKCIEEAIDLDDGKALENITSDSLWAGFLKEHGQTCGFAERAVRLERLKAMEDLLKIFDLNCNGCKETPLGVAAAEGKMKALTWLLNKTEIQVDAVDENNFTALVRAVRHCQLNAAELLLGKQSDVNHLFPPTHGSRCRTTALLSLFGRGAREDLHGKGACHVGNGASNGSLPLMINMLVKAGAHLSVEAQKSCPKQTALVEAINRGSLTEVELLLKLGADPNEEGRTGSGDPLRPLMALTHEFLHRDMGWQDLVRVVQLLVDHKADVDAQDSDEDGHTVMTQAAVNCRPELVKLFLERNASVEVKDKENMTVEEWTEIGCDENPTAQKEILAYLHKDLDERE